MLGLVVTLLIIALIAGILGFGGIAGAAVGIAKIENCVLRCAGSVSHFPAVRWLPRQLQQTTLKIASSRSRVGDFSRF
jgi:uncharacterized membrane protein YtjA (UPF0391 family)